MTSTRTLLPWGIVLGLWCGCHPVKPEMSVEGLPQACCTVADPTLQHFKGCRIPQRSCRSRKGEKFWMRGAISCGPVDEAACEGGRCCGYRPQYDPNITEPIENWAPPGFGEPTNNVTNPDAAPQYDVPPPGATPPAPPDDATAPVDADSIAPDEGTDAPDADPPAAVETPDAA